MTTLTEFLNARIDEDEAAAQAAASVAGPGWHHDVYYAADGGATVMLLSARDSPLADMLHRSDEELAPFLARHDPARVLREAEAKRAIIQRYERAAAIPASISGFVRGQDDGYLEACLDAVKDLAAVYSDHPDYDAEKWTP